MRTIGDRLYRARRRRFVGRDAELKTFRRALEAEVPPFAVMFVHGPGGVGKTALLNAMAALAREAGHATVLLDTRSVDLTRTVRPEPAGERGVLLLDSYERLIAIDDWVREEYLPGLPAGTLVVIGGREPPRPEWVSDHGWRELLLTVPLGNLGPDDGAALLREENVPERLHGHVLRATHGHPLALRLLVDVLSQRGDTGDLAGIDLAEAPDVVRLLLDRFLEGVPTPRHRRALEVCAHALVTTEELLRAALDDDHDPGGLFAWMRTLSFVEERPEGLCPHDLAREVFDADLRWRDGTAHQRLHRRIGDHLVHRLRTSTGAAQRRVLTELTFLRRANPAVRDLVDWSKPACHHTDDMRPEDRADLLAMTERHEGPESAKLAAFWMDRQPEAFVVARGPRGEPAGYGCRLRLDLASPQDVQADPGTRAMWEYARRRRPPAPGEEVAVKRFFVDRERHQRPRSAAGIAIVALLHRRLTSTRLGWDLIGAYSDADAQRDLFRFNGYHRAEEADFVVGGVRHYVYARDFRVGGIDAWLDLLAESETRTGPAAAVPEPSPLAAMSRMEFTSAVRRGLRDLHRPDVLAGNPLNAARTALRHDGGLAGLLREAAESLRSDSRNLKAYRAVDRTYLHPAGTQERAAEVLGLPFSTYRRHLTTGVQRIVDTIWREEMHGLRPPSP
ncbi:AAA ATPase-like protein [Thermomonospora umbrina]|uniref:AAA ATPase-like protein n=2 Tax=Thermomonospora umbrina TaxID=111806 RepID=A0A3D9T6J7_9ACTN|nr:AAA ATPase-like protein [Thermomonospora umbrina]